MFAKQIFKEIHDNLLYCWFCKIQCKTREKARKHENTKTHIKRQMKKGLTHSKFIQNLLIYNNKEDIITFIKKFWHTFDQLRKGMVLSCETQIYFQQKLQEAKLLVFTSKDLMERFTIKGDSEI